MWYDSKSEEGIANNGMAYSGRCEYDGESSTEYLSEEDLDTPCRLLLSKWEEEWLTIENHKKTIGVLQEET